MSYYKILSYDDELLAIQKVSKNDINDIWWHRVNTQVENELGIDSWWRASMTQVEFETYQAFGIREIKLCPTL